MKKEAWTSEPGGGRGAWIKSETGEWVALACGDTDESAARHAAMISATPKMLYALEAARVVLDAEGAKATLAIVNDAIAAARGDHE